MQKNSLNSDNNIVVAAFYCFFKHDNLEKTKIDLDALCNEHALKGTILLAKEGINSTIAGNRSGIDALKNYLFNTLSLAERIEYKESFTEKYPFKRLKIKIKNEILTFGEELNLPETVGTYLNAREWNEMLMRDDSYVVDTRNKYEIEGYGTFKVGDHGRAIDPETDKFTDFKQWAIDHLHEMEGKKVLMFCTGGIRCEKSTAYMKKLGIEDVYHVKGGILQYLIDVPEEENMWEGTCYIFDQREALDEKLSSAPTKNLIEA